MPAQGIPVEQLRDYLQHMKPEARALLIAELERSVKRGDAVPGAEIILRELRPTMRADRSDDPRLDQAGRHFFKTFEPFLIDTRAGGHPSSQASTHVPQGCIERASLPALWAWLGRDVIPDAVAAYTAQVDVVLIGGDERSADALARDFHEAAHQAIAALLSRAPDPQARRRIASQIAAPRAAENLRDLFALLQHRERLMQIASRLPPNIRNLGEDQLANIVALLRPMAQSPEAAGPALVLVMSRLSARWQLIRIAVKSAESDQAAKVAQAPLGAAAALVLDHMRGALADLADALWAGRMMECASLLKDIHDSVRGIRTEIDLSGESAFGRELGALRGQVARLLEGELAGLPGRMRRILRPRSAHDIAGGAAIDAIEVAELEARIPLAETCRNYAGELAINQVGAQVYADLQKQVDTGIPTLLDGLRAAGAAERPFRRAQAEAAVRFARRLFGRDYADGLARAVAVAGAEPGQKRPMVAKS